MKIGLHANLLRALLVAGLWATTFAASSLPQEPPVADAAMRGDIAEVRRLVRAGADVNAAHGDGMSALHWAAMRGDADMMKVLVRAGARVEAVTRIGDYTPLHLASKGQHPQAVRALLDARANVHAKTSTGGALPLHFAAGAGSVEAVTALLDRGADVNAREGVFGQTPLMFAAANNRLAALKVLLARGADVRLTTNVVDLPTQEAVDRAAGKRRDAVLAEAAAQHATPARAYRPTSAEVQAAVRAAQEIQRSGVTAVAEDAEPDPSGGEEVAGFSGLVGTQGGFTPLLHAVREGQCLGRASNGFLPAEWLRWACAR